MIFDYGRRFLDAYNAKDQTTYTPKAFFVEVFWPLFFDHEKHLFYVTNSPFVQQLKTGESAEKRTERLNKLIDDLATKQHNAAIVPGYPTVDILATTSGQVTDMELPIGEDEAYLSWIAAGLGVCVESGVCILFNNDDILLKIAEGWIEYRKFVDSHDTEGRQIVAWNAQWLLGNTDPTLKIGKIQTEPWQDLIFNITDRLPDTDQLIGFAYVHGQTNETYGYVPFLLDRVRAVRELYIQLFGDDDLAEVQRILGSGGTFKEVCHRRMAVDVHALMPEELWEVMRDTQPYYKYTTKKRVAWQVGMTWLAAISGDMEMIGISERLLDLLQRITSDKKDLLSKLLHGNGQLKFLDNIVAIAELRRELDALSEAVKPAAVMEGIKFPYFLAMMRLWAAKKAKE